MRICKARSTVLATLIAASTIVLGSASATEEFPRVVQLSENVYGHEAAGAAGMTTVSLFVVGRNGVLLADGQADAAATTKLVENIARVSDKPVKWYVVGSDHSDHTAGNSVLPKSVSYIVHPTSRAQLQRAAAAGGEGAAVVVPKRAMTGDQQTIDVGGIEARALFFGRAHTGGDLMLYLPKQKILFMSEVFLNRVFPALRSAYPSQWLDVIDRALALDVEQYISGHGAIEIPEVSRARLIEYRDALRYVIDEVRRLHRRGLSAEDARLAANWGPYRGWLLADAQDIVAIRRIYQEIDGKLP